MIHFRTIKPEDLYYHNLFSYQAQRGLGRKTGKAFEVVAVGQGEHELSNVMSFGTRSTTAWHTSYVRVVKSAKQTTISMIILSIVLENPRWSLQTAEGSETTDHHGTCRRQQK